MALSELQRAHITKRLRAVSARVPPELRDQIRIEFRIGERDVTLFESRPSYGDPQKWSEEEIAKFQYVAAADEWRLFCQFRDLKWRAYQPLPSARDFDTLVDEVSRDPTGIFWG